jgi:hypothetical protein
MAVERLVSINPLPCPLTLLVFPADTLTFPAVTSVPPPTANPIFPPGPLRDSPVATRTDPLAAPSASPVDTPSSRVRENKHSKQCWSMTQRVTSG